MGQEMRRLVRNTPLKRPLKFLNRYSKKGNKMKYVIAIIQPSKMDAVREALSALGIAGITVSEVQGYGRQKGKTEIYRGAEYEIHFLPKIKIEVAVTAKDEKAVIEAISKSAESGRIGDGKIFVFDLKQAVRIRTGEVGNDAL